jgi:hypothetical protein
VQAFGHRGESVINGDGRFFASEDTPAVVAAFERAGYRCVRDDALVRAAIGWAPEG